MKLFNPAGTAAPASNYSHGCLIEAGARRLIVAGQVGIAPDGTLEEGFAAQSRRCWSNLLAVLAAEGMTLRNLARVTVYVTEPGRTAEYRAIRDEVLEGHAPAVTYVQVAGLAHPDMLVEIEAEAVG